MITKAKVFNKQIQEWPASDLKEIKSPVLLIAGDSDLVCPEHIAEMFRQPCRYRAHWHLWLLLWRLDSTQCKSRILPYYGRCQPRWILYSAHWKRPVDKPALFLQNDSTPVLTFPFFNATRDAYLVTVKGTQHGNFCDFGAILAKNQTTTATVDGKEVEVSVLGTAEPLVVEDTINTLLLDFFGKYLKEKDTHVLDTQNKLQEIIIQKKRF